MSYLVDCFNLAIHPLLRHLQKKKTIKMLYLRASKTMKLKTALIVMYYHTGTLQGQIYAYSVLFFLSFSLLFSVPFASCMFLFEIVMIKPVSSFV